MMFDPADLAAQGSEADLKDQSGWGSGRCVRGHQSLPSRIYNGLAALDLAIYCAMPALLRLNMLDEGPPARMVAPRCGVAA